MLGQTISHYRILDKLGQGGMGVVYKARDTHLDRFVAIKVLPPARVADPERKRRFVQEAKAASALNHPNIITIYDIDAAAGVDFIAMEFVSGKTLDQLLPRKGMALGEAVKCAAQIADALAAAHEAGIVHRDLKPSNVMLTGPASGRPGQVKVLDFGLAKLTERPADEETPTLTAEGTILGTVAYMSPEQAQGKKVDARSDIFSFGALLYELVTGRRAFQGDTNLSTLAAIISQEPAALGPGIPHDLEKLITRCLRKDPERRFQHMSDLKVELEEVKQESDSGAVEAAPVPKPRRRWVWALALLAFLIAAAAGTWSLFFQPRAGAPDTEWPVIPLTSYPGDEEAPSFSPDGNQLVFTWNGADQKNTDIYVKGLDAAQPLRLTTDPAPDTNPAWSPDGRSIAFCRGAAIYTLAPLGGSERKLAGLTVPSSHLSWSPDSKFLAFSDKDSPTEPARIFLLSMSTLERRKLPIPSPRFIDQTYPDFSPDGRSLAFLSTNVRASNDINVVPATGGQPRQITFDGRLTSGLAWTPDSREILFSSDRSGEYTLWRIAASGGTPKRLPQLAGPGLSPAVSRLGRRLVFARRVSDSNIWRVDLRGSGRGSSAAAMLIASTQLDENPQYSPDGERIVFVSSRSGAYELWVSRSDGSSPVQLTSLSDSMQGFPAWSPDGSQIAFDSNLRGNWDIYVIKAQGSAPRPLTTEASSEARPSWSKDGRWVYFGSNRTGSSQIWKVPAGGGTQIQVTKSGGINPVVSPDGEFVYYSRGEGLPGLWRVPAQGGEETPVLEDYHGWNGRWAVAERGIYLIDWREGKGVLKFFDFGKRQTADVLTLSKPMPEGALSLSPDRRWLLYAQSDTRGSDLMLRENFR